MDNYIITTDGLLYKIRNFFRKLFKKEDSNNKEYIEKKIVEKNFKKSVAIKKDEEREKIFQLQKNLERKV